MKKMRLSNYSDKEPDIDCSHNQITTLILEEIYESYLFMPAALLFCVIALWVITGKLNFNLMNVTITWALAAIILMRNWPKWEPKTLNQIIAEEQTGIVLSGPHKSFK